MSVHFEDQDAPEEVQPRPKLQPPTVEVVEHERAWHSPSRSSVYPLAEEPEIHNP